MPHGHSCGKTSVQLNKHLEACSSSSYFVVTRKFRSDFSCSIECSCRHSSARSGSARGTTHSATCSTHIDRRHNRASTQRGPARSAAAAAVAATAVATATTHATAAWVDVKPHVNNKRQDVDYCVLRGNYARPMSLLDSAHRASKTFSHHSP